MSADNKEWMVHGLLAAKQILRGLLDVAVECEAATGETPSAEEALTDAISRIEKRINEISRQTRDSS